jgi:hypothetical protein
MSSVHPCGIDPEGHGYVPFVRLIGPRLAVWVVLHNTERVVMLEIIRRTAVKAKRNVVPGIWLEPVAYDAAM